MNGFKSLGRWSTRFQSSGRKNKLTKIEGRRLFPKMKKESNATLLTESLSSFSADLGSVQFSQNGSWNRSWPDCLPYLHKRTGLNEDGDRLFLYKIERNCWRIMRREDRPAQVAFIFYLRLESEVVCIISHYQGGYILASLQTLTTLEIPFILYYPRTDCGNLFTFVRQAIL